MINPPDDLLEDLQSALPPEQQPISPPPTSSDLRANGDAPTNSQYYDQIGQDSASRSSTELGYDRMASPQERGSVASSGTTVRGVLSVLLCSQLHTLYVKYRDIMGRREGTDFVHSL